MEVWERSEETCLEIMTKGVPAERQRRKRDGKDLIERAN